LTLSLLNSKKLEHTANDKEYATTAATATADKTPCNSVKEPHVPTKEPYIPTKVPYISGAAAAATDEKPNISANCTEYAAAAMVAAAKKPLVLAMKKGMLCGGGSY